jgi:hypothetical protein
MAGRVSELAAAGLSAACEKTTTDKASANALLNKSQEEIRVFMLVSFYPYKTIVV